MLYFLEDDQVMMLFEQDLLKKCNKELLHVDYLLVKKNEVTKRWSRRIELTVDKRRYMERFLRRRIDRVYTPMFINEDREEQIMPIKGTFFTECLNIKFLQFKASGIRFNGVYLGET